MVAKGIILKVMVEEYPKYIIYKEKHKKYKEKHKNAIQRKNNDKIQEFAARMYLIY